MHVLAASRSPAGNERRGEALPRRWRLRRQRSQAPDTAITTKFDVNGVSVILRRNTANEVVVANLYLLGGTRQLTPADGGHRGDGARGERARNAPLSRRGGSAAYGATRQHDRHRGERRLERDRPACDPRDVRFDVGDLRRSRHGTDARPGEVAIVRDQFLTVARERNTQPDDAATELADSLLYINHPNALSADGNAGIDRVADRGAAQAVPRAAVRHLAHAARRRRQRGPRAGGAARTCHARDAAARNVQVDAAAGSHDDWTSAGDRQSPAPDELPARLRTGSCGDGSRLHGASRRDSGALRAAVHGSALAPQPELRGGGAIPRARATPSAGCTSRRWIRTRCCASCARSSRRSRRNPSIPLGLKRLEQQFITEYYLKNETNADQANVLARAELYQGDYRAADRFMEGFGRVTPEDVRRVARQYLKDFRFAYVGDASKLDRALLNEF